MFGWLHSDITLKAAGLLSAAAVLVKAVAHPNTVAYHWADWVLNAGVGLGIYSSTGREAKE